MRYHRGSIDTQWGCSMLKRWMIAGLFSGLAFNAFAGTGGAGQVSDPWEGMNRKVFAFNEAMDRWVLKPVAKGYVKVTPRLLRRGIGNFFGNLMYPLVIVNNFLQGKFQDGASDTGRFIMNTTLGIGGLFDPAAGAGLHPHEEDFGQTFARWGAGSGPYLVLPFLGPSNVRDGIGSAASVAASPMRFVFEDEKTRYALSALYFIQTRASLLDAEQLISGDRYIFMRDAFMQRRHYLIMDGQVTDDFLDEDWNE
jgi:phospholipid-binding lipoprotein MlaA